MNFWNVRRPTAHMQKLCLSLGDVYCIRELDLERVLYRDFGNGYDIEVSGMNTTSARKKATIYLWKDRKQTVRVVKGVPQDAIGEWVDRLAAFAETITEKDFDAKGFFINKKYIRAS